MQTSFYERWILPRLIDLAMRNPEARRYRERLVPQARGRVLEIGIGSGLNLPYYGPEVERLYGLDPSERLVAMARRRGRRAGFSGGLFERPGGAGRGGAWALCGVWGRGGGGVPAGGRPAGAARRVTPPPNGIGT